MMRYAKASGECLSPEILILKRNGKTDLFFYPGVTAMTSPDQTSTDEPVAMRSGSSGYADINSVRPHLEINPAVRQMSYYEAVRGNTEVASPVSSMGNNSSSTVNLVEDLTCPKDMHNYQIRQHRMYPPIIEEEDPRGKVDPKSKRISRIVYLLLVAICVISVSLSIFCSVLTINMQKKIDDLEKKVGHRTPTSSAQESKPAASSMCVPCDDIKQGPFEEDNKQLATLDKRFENGLEICCATGSEQVATLLDLFTKRKLAGKCIHDYNETSHEHCPDGSGAPRPPTPERTISAHLQIGGRQRSDGSTLQPIRHWLTNRFVSHLDGVTVRNDRIIVPETGLYFVYSQAAFLIYYDPDKALTDHNQSIFHHVYRFNKVLPNNGVQELMRSDTSQCWEQNKQYSRYTSYVGAAIKLRKDDELFVKVSNVAALKIEPSLTYFGMFKL